LALTVIRCGARNFAAIGGTADITGLEAAGGSIENDPKLTWAVAISRIAASDVAGGSAASLMDAIYPSLM
jgi:hypothetical protein